MGPAAELPWLHESCALLAHTHRTLIASPPPLAGGGLGRGHTTRFVLTCPPPPPPPPKGEGADRFATPPAVSHLQREMAQPRRSRRAGQCLDDAVDDLLDEHFVVALAHDADHRLGSR